MEILTTKSNQAKIVSEIKRLNERMRDLERKGLTDTISYQKLSSWVANVPNRKEEITGRVRAIQTYKITPEQAKRTHALAKKRTYTSGAELKHARAYLERTGQDTSIEAVRQQANTYGSVEEHIRSNLEKIYVEAIKKDTKLSSRRKKSFIKIMKDEQLDWEQKKNKFDAWYKRAWKAL